MKITGHLEVTKWDKYIQCGCWGGRTTLFIGFLEIKKTTLWLSFISERWICDVVLLCTWNGDDFGSEKFSIFFCKAFYVNAMFYVFGSIPHQCCGTIWMFFTTFNVLESIQSKR